MCSNCSDTSFTFSSLLLTKIDELLNEKTLQDSFYYELKLLTNPNNTSIDGSLSTLVAFPHFLNSFEYIHYTPLWNSKDHHVAISDIASSLNSVCTNQFRICKFSSQSLHNFSNRFIPECTSRDSGIDSMNSSNSQLSLDAFRTAYRSPPVSPELPNDGLHVASASETAFHESNPKVLAENMQSSFSSNPGHSDTSTAASNSNDISLSDARTLPNSDYSLQTSRQNSESILDPFEILWPNGTVPKFLSGLSLELVHFVFFEQLIENGPRFAFQDSRTNSFESVNSNFPASRSSSIEPRRSLPSSANVDMTALPNSALAQFQRQLIHEMLCKGRLLQPGHRHGLLVPVIDIRFCKRLADRLDPNLEDCSIVYNGKRVLIGERVLHAMKVSLNVRKELLVSGLVQLRRDLYQMPQPACRDALIELLSVLAVVFKKFRDADKYQYDYNRIHSSLRGLNKARKDQREKITLPDILSTSVEFEWQLLVQFWQLGLMPIIARLTLPTYFQRANYSDAELDAMIARFKCCVKRGSGLDNKIIYRLWTRHVRAIQNNPSAPRTPALLSHVNSSCSLSSTCTSSSTGSRGYPGMACPLRSSLNSPRSPLPEQYQRSPWLSRSASREDLLAVDYQLDQLPDPDPEMDQGGANNPTHEWLGQLVENANLFPSNARWTDQRENFSERHIQNYFATARPLSNQLNQRETDAEADVSHNDGDLDEQDFIALHQ